MSLINVDKVLSTLAGIALEAKSKDDEMKAMFASSFTEQELTVDVEPVKHGHWCSEDGECSCCGRSLSEIMDSDSYFAIGFNLKEMKYCPWCGAKMDEEMNT